MELPHRLEKLQMDLRQQVIGSSLQREIQMGKLSDV